MTGFFSQVPLKLLCVALFGLATVAFLTVLLGWHGLRRLDVPRVPRRAGCTWRWARSGSRWSPSVRPRSRRSSCFAITGASTRRPRWATFAAKRSDPTACASSCERHSRRRRNAMRGPATRPRHRLGPAGRASPRARRAGRTRPVAHRKRRPRRLPAAVDGHRFINLVARRTEAVPVAVPLDAQVRSVLVSSLSGPVLQQRDLVAPRRRRGVRLLFFQVAALEKMGRARKSSWRWAQRSLKESANYTLGAADLCF